MGKVDNVIFYANEVSQPDSQYRLTLSLRDVENLLAERGIIVSFQTISEWMVKFGLQATAPYPWELLRQMAF